MLISLLDRMQQSGPAVIILCVAIMLLFGFMMASIAARCRLPCVTGYLLAGILLGPFCLDAIPAAIIEQTEFLADIALALIAFSTGEFFRRDKLRRNTGSVLLITAAESLTASAAVFALTYWVLHLGLPFSLVLAALACATAPASTMMTIRQTGSKGDFVDTLLQVVAYDDIAALLLYSVAISAAAALMQGQPMQLTDILLPIMRNVGVLGLGGLLGLILKHLVERQTNRDSRLIALMALLFAFCALCTLAGVSPLLGCMAMSTVYVNAGGDLALYDQLNGFAPPVLLLFFVRSGLSFDLHALTQPSGSVGGVSLMLVGVLYFFVRIGGKYLGAFWGCLCAKKPRTVRDYFGLALIPQAGVAIGLSALGARVLGPELGGGLQTVILASSVLYELIGPACAKLALYLSHSYDSAARQQVLPHTGSTTLLLPGWALRLFSHLRQPWVGMKKPAEHQDPAKP